MDSIFRFLGDIGLESKKYCPYHYKSFPTFFTMDVFDTEESLDAFICQVDNYCQENEPKQLFIQTPHLNGDFNKYPLLMKNSPQSKDKERSYGFECKKCELVKKQLEMRIEKLEAIVTKQYEELFESYSYLSSKLDTLSSKNGH